MSELQEKLDDLKVEITSKFNGVVMQDGRQCFAWLVTLKRDRAEVTVDFYTGIGCTKRKVSEKDLRKLKDGTWEVYVMDRWVSMQEAISRARVVPAPPKSADVLNCMFGSACDEDFSEWCANFGYSDDSIKAKRTYDKCQELERKAKRLLGSHYAEVSACEH